MFFWFVWGSHTKMPPMIDQETKQIIIQKTWCHGQAVAPVYGMVCLWWFISNDFAPFILLIPSLFLPYWCYLSYRSIFVDFSYKTILIGGILAEAAHIIVFYVAYTATHNTTQILMLVASILFFVETAAFLGVVTTFRPRFSSSDGNSNDGTYPRRGLLSYHNEGNDTNVV